MTGNAAAWLPNPDVRILFERLCRSEIGETVTYDELSGMVGRDVTGAARYLLTSARSQAGKKADMVFGTVRKTGLQRLNDMEIVGTLPQSAEHLRRSARRSALRASKVKDFAALPADQKLRHNAYGSLFAIVAHIAKPAQIKALEKVVNVEQRVLPLQKTLDAFREGSK